MIAFRLVGDRKYGQLCVRSCAPSLSLSTNVSYTFGGLAKSSEHAAAYSPSFVANSRRISLFFTLISWLFVDGSFRYQDLSYIEDYVVEKQNLVKLLPFLCHLPHGLQAKVT